MGANIFGYLSKFRHKQMLISSYFLILDNEFDEGCAVAHEVYDSETNYPLGTYTKFAVAADSSYCSTVGK